MFTERRAVHLATGILAGLVLSSTGAYAQNGISDERVSLPDGPGSIGGVGENVSVNPNMGSAAFNVPMQVPDGPTEAMTPKVALNYTSGAGIGLAGIGWTVSTPTIERMISKGLPTYTTADAFAADGGSELVYIGDLDGSRIYRARFEQGFARYRWWNAGVGAAGYWTVESPGGVTGYYGADAAGTTVTSSRVQDGAGATFRYHLVETRDIVGNRMVNTYVKDGGWPRVDEMQYGFGAETTPRFSVRWGYEDRPDITSNATPGYEIQLTKRVATVQVLSDATVIRRYELGYEDAAASGGMSRLATVSEFGRDGGKHVIEHRFQYTRTLAGACTVGCERPFMVDMGTLPGGVNIQTGLASLIDINGDSLPDVLETDVNGIHKFHISKLSTEGRPGFTGDAVTSTATVGGSSFILSNPGVQLLDVNGDGFSDIVDQANGIALCNTGAGDWSGSGCIDSPGDLPTLSDDPSDAGSESDPLGMRFFDYDNDKRIDLLRTPDSGTAVVSRNTGTGYAAINIDPIGAAFDVEGLQLTDVNGDGLQDPSLLIASGATSVFQYKLNLGFGRWDADWSTVAIDDLAASDIDNAVLEDLDGDGLADIVVVTGTTVNYWRNMNGGRFDARVTIASADVEGDIPERTESETVVFADMNGNGTDDIVWIGSNGHVRFLELFPVRPNLMSRIENGIGWVRVIEYGTSIAQRARDAGTADAWENPLPQSMNVVTATDNWVTLTGGDDGVGVHSREELLYRDGFYDGVEKSFRGFERVTRVQVRDEDDGQDPSLQVLEYDVGRDDPYRNGLLVRNAVLGGPNLDVPLREERVEFNDCPVAGVENAEPPVRHICQTATTMIHQEGAPEAEWLAVRTEVAQDGYGNVSEERRLGVVHMGLGASESGCAPCAGGAAGLASGACGEDCLGDEEITKTTYIVPGEATGGAWLLNLPTEVRISSKDGGKESVTNFYYDGPDFVGLALGQATKGLPTRTTERVSATETRDIARNAWDAHGNLAATLDANADASDATSHRREYTYDDRWLRITRVTVKVGDHDLVQDIAYESSFLKASESTSYRVQQGGTDLTPRNASSFQYDEFGRTTVIVRPGDSRDAPTTVIAYELGDPVSRIVLSGRKTPGGPLESESVKCQDGRGRTVQTLHKTGPGAWRVDGFSDLNSVGQLVRYFQPYTATTNACNMAPPTTTDVKVFQRDAVGRILSETAGDSSIHGTDSITRTTYAPLKVTTYDNNDTDATSPFKDTPTTSVFDGLERTIRVERLLTADGAPDVFKMHWDELGNLARVDDPAGNARVQTFDLVGRVTRTIDPNAGETTYTYTPGGQELSRTDARGMTVMTEYDGLNRTIARYNAADKEGTLETTTYDYDADCEDCKNAPGRVVAETYPLPGDTMGSDAYGYDARGNRTLFRRTLDGKTFETTFTYDGDRSLVAATYPDGQTLDYTYDVAARLTGIDGVLSGVTYTAAGQPATIAHANGVTDALTYDALFRQTAATATGPQGKFLDWSFSLDRNGNVMAVTDAITAAGHPSLGAQYAYDAYYRLTEAALDSTGGAVETLTYTYDALDNMTSRTSSKGAGNPGHAGNYRYGEGDTGPNFATTVGDVTYTSDEAGNTTSRDDLQLAWDHLGRLSEVAPADKPLGELGYGPDRERVLKTANGGITYYAAPNFVIRDGISSLYVKMGRRRIARLNSDALATTVLSDANQDDRIDIADAWLSRDASGETPSRLLRASARRLLYAAQGDEAHFHHDLRESVIASTDGAGALVAERTFSPYGAIQAATGWIDAFGFTGQELDEDSGLVRFQQRYLDVAAGRWMSPDPAFSRLNAENVLLLGESTTGYAYVGNNPTSRVDPTGELLFALFVKPIRKKIFPYRDRKNTSKKDAGEGGTSRAAKAKKPISARKQAKLDRRAAKKATREARLSEVTQRQAEITQTLESLPDPASVTNPASREQLEQVRSTYERENQTLSRESTVLKHQLNPVKNGNPLYLLPDVLLVAGVLGGTFAALSAISPASDDDSSDGSGTQSLFGGGGGE